MQSLISVTGYLITNVAANKLPLPPKAEWAWWYQYYFATERGVLGLEEYRHDLAELIWRFNSPTWDFDEATFNRTAAAFDNPDYVSMVIGNYRYRLGLVNGDPRYQGLEQRLFNGPVITVPTITIDGQFDPFSPLETARRTATSSPENTSTGSSRSVTRYPRKHPAHLPKPSSTPTVCDLG